MEAPQTQPEDGEPNLKYLIEENLKELKQV